MRPIQSKEKLNQVGEFYNRINEVHQDYLKYWMKNTVFHWDFWVSIFFVISSIIFWIVIRKKESSNRLLFSGMFVLIITSWFDLIGAEYGKWKMVLYWCNFSYNPFLSSMGLVFNAYIGHDVDSDKTKNISYF